MSASSKVIFGFSAVFNEMVQNTLFVSILLKAFRDNSTGGDGANFFGATLYAATMRGSTGLALHVAIGLAGVEKTQFAMRSARSDGPRSIDVSMPAERTSTQSGAILAR